MTPVHILIEETTFGSYPHLISQETSFDSCPNLISQEIAFDSCPHLIREETAFDSCPHLINPRPVGVCRSTRPVGEGPFCPPLRSREPRNVATSGKGRWIALGVNSLKHVNFLKIEVTGLVKLRSKVKYYCFFNGAY